MIGILSVLDNISDNISELLTDIKIARDYIRRLNNNKSRRYISLLIFQSSISSTNCKSRDPSNKKLSDLTVRKTQVHSRVGSGSFLYRDAPLNILNYFYFCTFFRARLPPIVSPRLFLRFYLSRKAFLLSGNINCD